MYVYIYIKNIHVPHILNLGELKTYNPEIVTKVHQGCCSFQNQRHPSGSRGPINCLFTGLFYSKKTCRTPWFRICFFLIIQPQGPCSGTLASNLLTAFGLLASLQGNVILREADRDAETFRPNYGEHNVNWPQGKKKQRVDLVKHVDFGSIVSSCVQ